MALIRTTHDQRGVHVDVVTGKVKRNQALENDGPSRKGGGQEHQKAGRCASIRHHVEDGAEARALLVVSCRIAVESVEEAGNAVQNRAGSRMEGHVVE